MKRIFLFLLAVCCLLTLPGCGRNRAAERREAFAAALREQRDLGFTADLRAEYADRTAALKLRYEEDGEGCTLRVLEPESIAGVAVHLDEAGAQLSLEELKLDVGPLDRWGLSPVSALPALTKALREGHLESAWTEDGLTVWELAADDRLTVQVWLDGDLIPQRAELRSDGRVGVYVEISEWTDNEE